MMYPKPTKEERKKRKKRTPTKILEDKLDIIFAKYIRLRDGKCVLSGSTQNLTCSHLIKRGKKSTRWSEVNCHAMTAALNVNHNFWPARYFEWFIQKFGIEELEKLRIVEQQMFKPTREWLADQILNYTILVDKLTSEKNNDC